MSVPSATNPAVETLILGHLGIVRAVVRETAARLPAHVDRDALTSVGMLALVEAAHRYDPDRGVPFHGYARTRIRGAMTDELRAADDRPGPRDAKGDHPLSLDGAAPALAARLTRDPAASVEDVALARMEAVQLRHAIAALPARLRAVLHAAFYDSRTHREAAAAAGIPTGNDFYLLRSEAIRALRAALGVPTPAHERTVPLPRRLAAYAA